LFQNEGDSFCDTASQHSAWKAVTASCFYHEPPKLVVRLWERILQCTIMTMLWIMTPLLIVLFYSTIFWGPVWLFHFYNADVKQW